jgi:hypothetical protein
MSTETDLWCFGLTDFERAIIGEKLARSLNMVPSENGLYSTAQGDITPLELFRAINTNLFKFAIEVDLEHITLSRAVH